MRGDDIAQLPESVRRYLIFMGVMGRPRDWSIRLHWSGRCRLRPEQSWVPCTAWQYSSLDVARGAPTSFGTDDRCCHDPYTRGHPLIRARWTTPITGWSTHRERPLPTGVRALWHLPGGVFEYLEVPTPSEGVAFNLPPGI